MITETWIDSLPTWVLFFAVVALVLLCIAAGYGAAAYRRRHIAGEPEGPIGSIVGAVLGLLAFILAFTFGVAASRFDLRKQLFITEVNAIGTALLRADLLPEPHRKQCRDLLKEYVNLRVEAHGIYEGEKLAEVIAASESLQDKLWDHVRVLAGADMNSPIGALFVASLNDVFDAHTSRVTVAIQYRITSGMWLGLLCTTVCAMMAVGYQFGIAGRNNFLVYLILATAYAAVVLMIADLDRSMSGGVRVNQQSMIDLQQKLSVSTAPQG